MEMRKIDVLNNLKGHVLWPQSYHLSEAEAEVCIKTLEQELCDDAISRQAVISAIYDDKSDFKNDFAQGFFADKIRDLPPVNPQAKMVHWSHDGSHWKNRFICSECGYKLFDEPTNYCANCGAKMESEVRNEN